MIAPVTVNILNRMSCVYQSLSISYYTSIRVVLVPNSIKIAGHTIAFCKHSIKNCTAMNVKTCNERTISLNVNMNIL